MSSEAYDRHDALAEIALAGKRPDEALREIRVGDASQDHLINCFACTDARLGRAFDLANQPDSAIAAFERFLVIGDMQRYHSNGDGQFLAGAEKRLGELYEARGDHARAAAHYASFVALWKDADPDLQPVVTDVRRRLARLSDTERK